MQPLPYDYYGEYGYKKNDPFPYVDRLVKDYTFDFPKQHDKVELMSMIVNVYSVVFYS